MTDLLGNCGLVCSECPAYIATQTDDSALMAKTARQWTKSFHHDFKPEDIVCDGCTASGRHSGYCAKCPIRACASGRGVETCAECDDYGCETVLAFLKHAPEAKATLERLRKPQKKVTKRSGTRKRKAT